MTSSILLSVLSVASLALADCEKDLNVVSIVISKISREASRPGSLPVALSLAKKYHLILSDEFLKLPEEEQFVHLKNILIPILKLPPMVHASLAAAEIDFNILVYGIEEYTGGVPVGEVTSGAAIEDVRAGFNPQHRRAFIVLSKFVSSDQASFREAILHELGHGVDCALRYLFETQNSVAFDGPSYLSLMDPTFLKMRSASRDQLGAFEARRPEEAFAFGFANYFLSTDSRKRLKERAPDLLAYLRVKFGR